MMLLLLLAAVAAGAFWAGKQSRPVPPDVTHGPVSPTPTHDDVANGSSTPVWPWVVAAALLGVLVLGMAGGPAVIVGGPALYGGPGGLFAGLLGP
jgi:hypothetical protein